MNYDGDFYIKLILLSLETKKKQQNKQTNWMKGFIRWWYDNFMKLCCVLAPHSVVVNALYQVYYETGLCLCCVDEPVK